MSESELLTIGAFARACGLSASALRFYADAGVLVPALVDEISGYRYYAPDQAGTAQLIRHLRAVDMPLPAVVAVLAEHDSARAAELVDAHLTGLDRQLQAVRAAADAARAAVHLGPLPASAPASVSDPILASCPAPAPAPASCPATAANTIRATNPTPSSALDPTSVIGPGSETGSVSAIGTVAGADSDPLADGVLWVRGPMLAAAVDQIATATVMDPDVPVLNSIHLEARGQELVLTATDRYRLATRSLRPVRATTAEWAATVDADDLRAAASWLRRRHTVALRPGATHLEITSGDPVGTPGSELVGDPVEAPGTEPAGGSAETAGAQSVGGAAESGEPGAPGPDRRRCRRAAGEFPDYRAMLAALPAVVTRVVLNRAELLDALERTGSPTITLHVTPGCGLDELAQTDPVAAPATLGRGPDPVSPASGRGATADPAGAVRITGDGDAVQLPATVTGPGMTIHFAVITLYPAVAGAVGPDVMLDLVAPDLPARIRSADDGDQLTLAMPCRQDTEEISR
ncbi:MerR family transcriptional regulator [Nocardia rhizosphaerihabitans]|uniref:DNA polymerase III subunit beta family protein n=1 Tax=Nocardia rhizosphaerihabitans TaxID=1691570 RepID=UPI00366BBB91